MIDEFSTEGYQRHNRCRQEHLASLGLPLENKSVLELGAGIGDHSSFFLDRGCDVTCIEGRHLNASRLRFRHPLAKVVEADLDAAANWFPRHQIVYAYGILYHLAYPAKALASWAEWCNELLLLETCVNSRLGFVLLTFPENTDSVTGSLRGWGCRPSRQWVFQELRRHFPFVYCPKTQPDQEEFPVDWSSLADSPLEPEGLIRAIFIGSQTKLENPLLTEELPMLQGRP